ncbi:MAG: hypothetical protein ACK559_37540, partial [bacterium]
MQEWGRHTSRMQQSISQKRRIKAPEEVQRGDGTARIALHVPGPLQRAFLDQIGNIPDHALERFADLLTHRAGIALAGLTEAVDQVGA